MPEHELGRKHQRLGAPRQRADATAPATLIAATASTDSAITGRRDRIVAATVTGARIRIENGFCKPPVR